MEPDVQNSSREVSFDVAGWPPAKSEALSMLGPVHSHKDRVLVLLEAARSAIASSGRRPFIGPIGLDVTLRAPAGKDPWDATNYLGGIGDVLERDFAEAASKDRSPLPIARRRVERMLGKEEAA